jgi:hypothetical protein
MALISDTFLLISEKNGEVKKIDEMKKFFTSKGVLMIY